MNKIRWFARRYLDFRWGYAYLGLLIGLLGNETLFYYFLIRNVSQLKTLFPEFIDFAVFGSLGVIAVAVSFGHFLYKPMQLETDSIIANAPMISELERRFRIIVKEELENAKHGV